MAIQENPSRQLGVPKALSELAESVGELCDAVEKLHSRLESVRSEEPEGPKDSLGKMPPMPTRPDLINGIDSQSARIRTITEQIRYNLRTIEI